jgi:hypothetical protein
MVVAFVVGVACLVIAYFVNKSGKTTAAAGASAPAATSRD